MRFSERSPLMFALAIRLLLVAPDVPCAVLRAALPLLLCCCCSDMNNFVLCHGSSVTCLQMKKPSWQKARILHLSTQLEDSIFNSKESLVCHWNGKPFYLRNTPRYNLWYTSVDTTDVGGLYEYNSMENGFCWRDRALPVQINHSYINLEEYSGG